MIRWMLLIFVLLVLLNSATGVIRKVGLGRLPEHYADIDRAANGIAWGGLLGVLAWWLYGNVDLGLVMTGAMTLRLFKISA